VVSMTRDLCRPITASRTVTSVVTSHDLMLDVFDTLSRVMEAINAPKPHPEWGDDGSRDTLREWAMEDLERTETKLQKRRSAP